MTEVMEAEKFVHINQTISTTPAHSTSVDLQQMFNNDIFVAQRITKLTSPKPHPLQPNVEKLRRTVELLGTNKIPLTWPPKRRFNSSRRRKRPIQAPKKTQQP